MLKRNGQLIRHQVPGFQPKLTDSEMASYNAAFAVIEPDYKEMESAKEQLGRLANVPWDQAAARAFATITTPDGNRWDAHARLLKLPQSEVLLCRRSEGNELAIIQRFQPDSAYAKTHGAAAILLTRNCAERELVTDYVGQAEITLRFMARNLVAKAQHLVWGEYPDNNPSRVVRAISERCALAVENPQALKHDQADERTMRPSRGIRI